MKNLLIFVHPSKNFDDGQIHFRRTGILAKIQIDNSLDLGWKKEDILLITNFPYQYNEVKSIVIDDSSYCPFRPLSTKTVTVAKLLEQGVIEKRETYWVHDFDAYQLSPFNDLEPELNNNKDIALTDYGWMTKWQFGSIFFKESAKDIFQQIKDTIYKYHLEDERAFKRLLQTIPSDIKGRIKKLNISYNFGMRHVESNYAIAQKPIKVLHFHPYYMDTKLPENTLNCFMYGKNRLKIPLMSDRLIKIFNYHGIK